MEKESVRIAKNILVVRAQRKPMTVAKTVEQRMPAAR